MIRYRRAMHLIMNKQLPTDRSKQQFNAQESNSKLLPSQKEQKRHLKSKLKFQRRIHKLETRITHAISRKDKDVELQARKDLDELLHSQSQKDDIITQHTSNVLPETIGSSHNTDAGRDDAIAEVNLIFRKLLTSIHQGKEFTFTQGGSLKEVQNSKARNLLHHMTKGTQTPNMFQDISALRGYVRKKFHGRAALIIKSLGELSPEVLEMAPTIEDSNQRKIMNLCYSKLAKVERVCSIGCGPGNDVVGLITFLRHCISNELADVNTVTNETNGYKLKEVMLIDFAINEWKEAALNDLIPILKPEYVDNISCQSCDVTKPIKDEEANNPSIAEFVQSADIFLTSYLLSETRNSWNDFYIEMVQLAPQGALFYFSEPMAWQLHRLIKMSTEGLTSIDGADSTVEDKSAAKDLSALHRLKFVWIDSSMYYPELQQMDGRAGGPAVLLAIKL